jgi:hypothetical protein
MPAEGSYPPKVLRLAVGCWIFFGVIMAGVGFAKGQDWTTALATGFLAGGAFAVLIVLLSSYYRMGRSVEEDDTELSEPQRRAATRAATRGPVPPDPDVRRAALRLAVYRLERLTRHMTLMVSVFSVLFVVEIVLAFTVSPVHWFGVVLAALAVAARVGAHARLRRRVDVLGIASPSQPVAATPEEAATPEVATTPEIAPGPAPSGPAVKDS